MNRIVTVLLAAMMLFSCMQIAAAEEITEAAASDESMGVKQGAEARAEEEPAAEEPAAEEPAAEEPAAEEPAAEEPAAKAPSDDTSDDEPPLSFPTEELKHFEKKNNH